MKDFIIPPMDPKSDRDMGTPAKSGKPVTLTIDGFEVTVPEGTSAPPIGVVPRRRSPT